MMKKLTRIDDYAYSVPVITSKVRDGWIKVYPRRIVYELEDFNEKFNTSFGADVSVNTLVEYLRNKFNKATFGDRSDMHQNTKKKFNEEYAPFARVYDSE